MEVGAQFYTIRDYCKNLDDFAESLKKVADIGYKNVQISGVCPYEPQWLDEQLKKTGLKCVITHSSPDAMVQNPEQVAANHAVFGCDCIGIGGAFFDREKLQESIDQFVEKFTRVGQVFRDNGKLLMYHNHAHEFEWVGGRPILQQFAERMDPNLMGFTVDTYWVQAGGADPAQWIEKLSGRVPCIHLKDYAYSGGAKMAVIGEGNINFDRVFEKAESAGTKYMLVEQDDCYGEDPFDCLKRSYENLRAFGFR